MKVHPLLYAFITETFVVQLKGIIGFSHKLANHLLDSDATLFFRIAFLNHQDVIFK